MVIYVLSGTQYDLGIPEEWMIRAYTTKEAAVAEAKRRNLLLEETLGSEWSKIDPRLDYNRCEHPSYHVTALILVGDL